MPRNRSEKRPPRSDHLGNEGLELCRVLGHELAEQWPVERLGMIESGGFSSYDVPRGDRVFHKNKTARDEYCQSRYDSYVVVGYYFLEAHGQKQK